MECASVSAISGFSKHAFREVPFGFHRGTLPSATLVPPEVPYKVPPWSLPMPQECPNVSPKKRTWYQPRRHVCIARFLLRSASQVCRGTVSGTAPFPRKCFRNVLGTSLEGTFECKARLEIAEYFRLPQMGVQQVGPMGV